MKKLALLVLGILVLALTAYYVTSELPGVVAHTPSGPSESELRPADTTEYTLAYVHDGDTLYLQPLGTSARDDQLKVRMLGIDTPELRPTAECFAVEARDRLRELLPVGATVWAASDVESVDQYGRDLLYLWDAEGDFVNLQLVREGFASAVRVGPNTAHWTALKEAEQAAREARVGQWGSCR